MTPVQNGFPYPGGPLVLPQPPANSTPLS